MGIIPTTKITKDGLIKIVNSDKVPERLKLGWTVVDETKADPLKVELPRQNVKNKKSSAIAEK
jgi:hypothetical protein